jgi:catechol 2,3-dioxygenase-like lactoylglutathione lyase family enzyme
MRVEGFDSLVLFVSSLADAKGFYIDVLGLPLLFEDEIIVVVGDPSGRALVLHCSDRGHDERGIFPAGSEAGAASLRFVVSDPDAWEAEAGRRGVPVLLANPRSDLGKVCACGGSGRPAGRARPNARHVGLVLPVSPPPVVKDDVRGAELIKESLQDAIVGLVTNPDGDLVLFEP